MILDKCGLWGSLMVGILVSKIAQYIMKAKVDPKLEMCHFATACFKGQSLRNLAQMQEDNSKATAFAYITKVYVVVLKQFLTTVSLFV